MIDIPEMHSLEMLRADNEALRREMATNMIYKKEADELRAKIERLRAMLYWIEDYDPQIVEAAREKFTLAGKEE